MSRQVIFRPAAEHEMLEAGRWFEERSPELLFFTLVDDNVVVAGVVRGHRDSAVWRSKR